MISDPCQTSCSPPFGSAKLQCAYQTQFKHCACCFAELRVARTLATVASSALKCEHGLRHIKTCQWVHGGFYAIVCYVVAVGSVCRQWVTSGLIVQVPRPFRRSEIDFQCFYRQNPPTERVFDPNVDQNRSNVSSGRFGKAEIVKNGIWRVVEDLGELDMQICNFVEFFHSRGPDPSFRVWTP
uniref:Uncharacterized protein n=1 Tax=Ananas comosus var. bracteatus TaxID=296719 RepID=A0A6V7Q5T6_ANACO|nr:unnamed protein product [Ananas comosus var. bracteatus]